MQRKDGSSFTALVTDTTLRDDDGTPVGLVGVSTDLDHAVQPLLARSSDAALILSPTAHITYVSPAASRLFGRTEQDSLGVVLWDVVHPQDRATLIDHHRLITADPTRPQVIECRLLADDGTCRWAEVTMTNMLGDPAVRGLVCNLRDVTERREDRDQLAMLATQLRTALTSRITVDRATGYLAGRTGVDLQAAFDRMRGYARNNNRRLEEVAGEVLSGTLRLTP